MTTSLKYENLEIDENKFIYSYEEQSSVDTLENLVNQLPKDFSFSFKDLFIKAETREINYFKSKIKNLDIKEQILLNSIHDIKLSLKNEKEIKEVGNCEYDISSNIFKAIDRVVHKALHKNKNIEGKEIKECSYYDDLNIEIIELGENYKFNDIDKFICNLKEENKIYEFIAIKSIMISLKFLMKELIQSYIEKNEKLVNNRIKEENGGDIDTKIDLDFEKIKKYNLIEINIFEDIYNDFDSLNKICSNELEEYFIYSLNSFREKYQMNFTLSELFTDIFWNSIFHNKKLNILFINSYCNEEINENIKIYLINIFKIIFNVTIPLKHQIVELLGLQQFEINEVYDLMTLIVTKKNYHSKLLVSEIEKEKEKTEKENNENNLNLNNNNEQNININLEKEKEKEIETFKYNIITANDISVIKNKKKIITVNNDTNSNLDNNIKIENKIENENKNKENNINYLNKKKSIDNFELEDLEHKTVDEIYNYINDEKIVRNKKKKKARKKKSKKEKIIEEDYQEEIEDSIVVQFKEDLSDKLIHAKNITKIKPNISEEWIKIISEYN